MTPGKPPETEPVDPKDAEIERLQRRLLEFIDLNIADRRLISEMADALESYLYVQEDVQEEDLALLQRAWEATK